MIFRIVYNGIDLMGSDLDSCVLDPSLEQELNTAGSLTFTMPPTHPMWGAMKVFVGDIEVYENGELIFFGRIVNIDQNWNNERIIECEGALAFFNDTYIDGHVRWDEEGTTVGSFFTDIVNRHNALVPDNRKIFVGNIDQSFMNYLVTREVEWEKTLDVISQMCIDTNGGWLMLRKDLEEDKIYIDWVKDITSGIDQPVQFGLNLLDVTKSYHGEDICTAVIPRGEQNDEGVYLDISEMPTVSDVGQVDHTYGSNILYHHEGVENHGAVLQVHDFSSCATKEDLYEEARVWLIKKNTDVATIEVEAAELGYFGDGYPIFKVGKLVEVIDGIHFPDETTVTYPMYKISMNLDSGKKQITIGTPPKKELTQIYASDVDSTGNGGVKSGTSSGGSGGSGSGDGVTDVIVNGSSVVNNHVASFSAVSTNQMNTAINNATSGLASTSYVDNAVAPKANTSDVNTALALKANTSDVNQALSTKANASDVTSALALKADKTEIIDVVANPSGTGSTDLTKLKVGNDIYNIPSGGGGTEVEANPSEPATDDLTTIKIGNIVYDIPGGGSGGSGQGYTCDVLFDTPTTISTWASPIEICTEATAKEYDMLYVVSSTYAGEPMVETILVDAIGYSSNHEYIVTPRTDSNVDDVEGFVFLSFDSGKLKFYAQTGHSSTLVKVYGLKFESSVDIFSPQIYSEDERVVGVWIDGKPLYQKVVDCGYGPNSSTKEIDLTALNIDNCIQIGGYMCHNNTSFLPIPRVSDRFIADQLAFSYNNSTKLLVITCRDRDMTGMRIMAILKYTKTTDTAGSSHWLSGGVIAVNYTEDEQIIGQYLGKTLYQKTIDCGLLPDGSSINVNTPNDIDDLVFVNGYAYSTTDATQQRPVPLSGGGTNDIRVDLYGGTIRIVTFANWSSYHAIITIQYTKTTDTAGNPMANILATQKELEEIAYHYRDHCYTTLSDYYSTEERVVGRWTDGKPLYQKTYITDNVTNGYQIDVSGLSIDKLIDKSGTFRRYRANSYLEQFDSIDWRTESSSLNDYGVTCKYAKSSNLIIFYVGGYSDSVITTYVTIQYTKSTDAPGTGPTPGNLVYLPALYSEEEREVGVWTDGKPIYQKTWKINLSAPNANTWYNTGIKLNDFNIDTIINGEVIDINKQYISSVIGTMSNNTYIGVNTFIGDRTLIKITIQYTKTTDQPGSGRYLPDGQYSHHYSTSEHIVGTWIDGSTIYERTWDLGSSIPYTTSDAWEDTGITIPNAKAIYSGITLDTNVQTGEPNLLRTTQFYLNNQKVYIKFDVGAQLGGCKYRYITLQYTKSS